MRYKLELWKASFELRLQTSHQNLSKFTRNPKDFVRRIIALRSIKTTELKKTPRSS